uniref:Uncharacterized protein n=1 Tax=Arundo donax TaxID=35708 RepID=A0A0A9C1L0_ARUDO
MNSGTRTSVKSCQ